MATRSCSPDSVVDHGATWLTVQTAFSLVGLAGYEPVRKMPQLMMPGRAGISLVLDAIIGLLLAVPLIAIQLQLGSKVNAGIVELFSKFSPLFKGIGAAFLVKSLQSALHVQQTSANTLLYFWYSVSPEPAWSSCQQSGMSWTCESTNVSVDTSDNFTTALPTMNITNFIDSSCQSIEMDFYKQNIVGNVSISGATFGQLVTSSYTFSFPKTITSCIAWFLVLTMAIAGAKATGWMAVFLSVLLTGALSGVLAYGWNSRPFDALKYLESVYTFSTYHVININNVFTSEMVRESVKNTFYSFVLVSGLFPSIGKYHGRREISQITVVIIYWLVISLFPHLLLVVLAPFLKFTDCDATTGEELIFVTWPSIVVELNIHPAVSATLYIAFYIMGLSFSGLIVCIVSENLTAGPKYSKQDACYCLAAMLICVVCFGVSVLFCTNMGPLWMKVFITTANNIDFVYMLLLLLFCCIFLGKTSSFQGTANVLCNVWFTIATFVLFAMATSFPFVSGLPRGYDWLIASCVLAILTLVGAIHAIVQYLLCQDSRHVKKCRVLCCGVPDELVCNTVSPAPPPLGATFVLTVGTVESPAPAYTATVDEPPPVVTPPIAQHATTVQNRPRVQRTNSVQNRPPVQRANSLQNRPPAQLPFTQVQPPVEQSAPPYYLYEERPLRPSPRGQYTVPKDDVLDQGVLPGC